MSCFQSREKWRKSVVTEVNQHATPREPLNHRLRGSNGLAKMHCPKWINDAQTDIWKTQIY